IAGGGADDDLFCATVQVRLRLFGIGKEAGRLDDQLGANLGPFDGARVALGEDLYGPTVDHQVSVLGLDRAIEPTIVGVVLKQVRVGLRIHEVVNRHDLERIRMPIPYRLEDLTPDATETVDADLDCHARASSQVKLYGK